MGGNRLISTTNVGIINRQPTRQENPVAADLMGGLSSTTRRGRMLVLSRRMGESIIIGSDEHPITVRVLSIQGRQVRYGITAPRSVPIYREELKFPEKRIKRTCPSALRVERSSASP